MERIHSINPERIIWCCDDLGIAADTLADEVGISVSTLNKVLQGDEDSGLTFNQLTKIAGYFGRGVLFFLEQEPIEDDQVHTLAFRTLANQKPELSPKLRALIERVERQRAIYIALKEESDDIDLPSFQPPLVPIDSPREAAKIVRDWLSLKADNDFDAYRLAVESKGILVFRSNGYNGKWQIASENPVMGFALYDSTCPVIVIKKQQWETQQTFTLMHEMGHLIMHRSSSIDDENDMQSHQGRERDANAFAGHLLVPDDFLQLIDDRRRPANVADFDVWLDVYKRRWGVSVEVILRRLLDNGRLSQQQYVGYRALRANLVIAAAGPIPRMFRHREPKNIFGDNFVRTVLEALSGRRISLAKASSYLDGLKVSELHKLERYYAGL